MYSVTTERERASSMELKEKIARREAKVTVVGLGYVGLPLAVEFARAGLRVAGLDVCQDKIAQLKQGESYIRDVHAEDIRPILDSQLLTPTTNPAYVNLADVVVICVPTPCSGGNQPDLSFVESAARTVASQLKPGQLVILESTSFPGTTEEVLQPILEETGLRAGKDFYLAFSPERIDPGNAHYNVRNTPKLVAGTTPDATVLAEAVYSTVAERVLRVSNPRTAEMTKLYENTFRHVNIAFANEMASLCEKMGIDIWEVIGAASSKPFGFMPFYPGPGVGGHCIPVDPQYLRYTAAPFNCDLKSVRGANEVNERMPDVVTRKVENALDEHGKSLEGAHLLVLGVAYKRDIDDMRESPAVRIIESLVARGAKVRYHDPFVPSFKNGCGRFESVALTDEELRSTDCVVICTDHSSVPYEKVASESSLVVDTRNVLRRVHADSVLAG